MAESFRGIFELPGNSVMPRMDASDAAGIPGHEPPCSAASEVESSEAIDQWLL